MIEKVESLYLERSDIATSLMNTDSMMNSLQGGMAGLPPLVSLVGCSLRAR